MHRTPLLSILQVFCRNNICILFYNSWYIWHQTIFTPEETLKKHFPIKLVFSWTYL